jgi:hypothetical protein
MTLHGQQQHTAAHSAAVPPAISPSRLLSFAFSAGAGCRLFAGVDRSRTSRLIPISNTQNILVNEKIFDNSSSNDWTADETKGKEGSDFLRRSKTEKTIVIVGDSLL